MLLAFATVLSGAVTGAVIATISSESLIPSFSIRSTIATSAHLCFQPVVQCYCQR